MTGGRAFIITNAELVSDWRGQRSRLIVKDDLLQRQDFDKVSTIVSDLNYNDYIIYSVMNDRLARSDVIFVFAH